MMIGVPGSGKSTWIKKHNTGGTMVASSDAYIDTEAERQGKTYNDVFKSTIKAANNHAQSVAKKAFELGLDLIWDQTSTTIASRARKFNALPDYEHIAVVFATPELNELHRRLASRPGKNIPSDVMVQMIKGLQMPTTDEGFKEIWNVPQNECI